MRWLKRRLIGWLLKDVEIEELKVRKLRIGESTVTIDANSITLPSLTADPTLAEGRLWYRADLDRLQYAIDTATKREIPYGTINVDAHASRHVAGGADAIPDGGIARSQLEYPTVDINFGWLGIKEVITILPAAAGYGDIFPALNATFADKAVERIGLGNETTVGRWQDANNQYDDQILTPNATADYFLHKYASATGTTLASEAVDLGDRTVYRTKLSISGSTLKGFRDDMTTPKISATDTTFASGYWGPRTICGSHGDYMSSLDYYDFLRATASPLQPAQAVLELGIEGSGKPEDPFRPSPSKNLAEITSLTGLPDFLYQEAKKYSILKAKGFTDEEIKTIFGYIPQHQVDLDSVTWGAFELHPDKAPTAIVTITADNPYKSGAILRQIDFAKGKNLKVFSPPRDYNEAVALYNQLKRDYPHWVAGVHNFAYQTLGWEILDWMQNVDFYYGELLEHKTHYQQLKQVSDREITGRLNELIDKLSRETALVDERDKHIGKAKEILKKGW